MVRRFTNDQFIEAVKTSITISDVLRKLGMSGGGNHNTVKKLVRELNLDTSHWLGQRHLLGKKRKLAPKIATKDLLIKGPYRSTDSMKRRLIKEGILKDKCYECGISEWRGKKLSLHLDHINGDNTDNRLKNLRVLCPNCHSITETYCGKNSQSANTGLCVDCKKPAPARRERCDVCQNKKLTSANGPKKCVDCGIEISKGAKRCQDCHMLSMVTKIIWPPTKELIKMVESSSFVKVAKELGVSDNMIRKRIKNHPTDKIEW